MTLSLSNFEKSYGNQQILSIPDLDLNHGIYWIKGENGSGKSTLFKSICGISPFEGEILLDRYSCKKNPKSYRKLVSYSEAEPIYPDFLTQKDLITFYAKTRKSGQDQINTLVEELGTSAYLNQSVKTFSSGMLKKTGLLLAFLGDVKLIVLDEPFITIDKNSTNKLVELILQYYQRGVTFLISSHIKDGGEQLPITMSYCIKEKTLVEV